MIGYLTEVSICLAAFLLFYWLFLAKSKLLELNRSYLLLAVIISVFIPLPDIPLASAWSWNETIQVASGNNQAVSTGTTPDYSGILLTAYYLGLTISLSIFITRLIRVGWMIKTSKKVRFNEVWLIRTNQVAVSSFFSYVFIPHQFEPDIEESRIMIEHELVHARQQHSLDLVFTNLLVCFFWFNPFAYAYLKSLKLQHEYIADELVAGKQGKQAYVQALIKHSLHQAGIPLGHAFATHPVEKRLKMIDKPNSNNMKKLSPLFSLPVLAVLFLSFACSESETELIEPQAEPVLEIVEEATGEPEQILLEVIDANGKISQKIVSEEIIFEETPAEASKALLEVIEKNGTITSHAVIEEVVFEEKPTTESKILHLIEVPEEEQKSKNQE